MTGMEFLGEFLPIVIYILLIILLIVAIVLGIKFIITMNKIESVVDDVNDKVKSLDKVFNIIDFTTDKIALFSDKIVELLTTGVSKVIGMFNRRKDEENE